MSSFLLSKYIGMEWLGHMVDVFLISMIFQSDCTILHSHQQSMRMLVVPHASQHLVLAVFNFSHSSGYVTVYPPSCLNLHFPDK